jgi:hypothetical protein
MMKIYIPTLLLCTMLMLISCSKNRHYKDAVIIYKSDCNEYLIQLTEGPDYLDTPLKPEFLEDKFKVDLLEIKLIYNVTDSLTYCNLPGTTPIVSISKLKKR